MIVGIDLGTTHSLIAIWKEGKSQLVPNAFQKFLTPSVVGLDQAGQVVVGEAALKDPKAIANFKRYMGTQKKFKLGKETYSPEELSAFILKSLIRDAAACFPEPLEEVVISVPAYFNDTQRKATLLASKLAGLKVERLINEPTAAALSYGIHLKDLETKFLVFDLGGGTFDISVVELFSGIIEVCSSTGDNYLGGEDFSHLLEQAVAEELQKEHDIDIKSFNAEKTDSFKKAVTKLKHALTNQITATFSLQLDDKSVSLPFTRDRLDTLMLPLLERIRRPLLQALHDARLKPEELDEVILVGGATRMPLIQNEIGKLLGMFPKATVHPDEAVAIGAGIQAALKQRHQELADVVITDVCPFTLGTTVVYEHAQSGSRFLPIIERNTTIPASRSQNLVPTQHNQKTMTIPVFQGESIDPKENICIGTLKIPIPPALAGQERVEVRYSYDANGLLEVEATVLSTGIKKNLLIKNQDHTLSEEAVAKSLKKLKAFKIHPRDQPENRTVLAKLNHLFKFFSGDERNAISDMAGFFHNELDSYDPKRIETARLDVLNFINDFFEDFEA